MKKTITLYLSKRDYDDENFITTFNLDDTTIVVDFSSSLDLNKVKKVIVDTIVDKTLCFMVSSKEMNYLMQRIEVRKDIRVDFTCDGFMGGFNFKKALKEKTI